MRFLFVVAVMAGLLLFGCIKEKTPAITGGNATDCGQIRDADAMDECYVNASMMLKDAALCAKVHEKNSGLCYWIVAGATQNISVCENIQDKFYLEKCYSNIAAATKNATICEKVQAANRQNSCYAMVALALNDSSICNKIQDSEWRDGCYKSTVKAQNVTSMSECEKIRNAEGMDTCYSNAAVVLEDVSACDMIRGALAKWCYPNVAIALNDSSICERSQIANDRDLCYFRFATVMKNSSVCGKMRLDQDTCYSMVERR